jgi:H+/gluconate symporter-like permease
MLLGPMVVAEKENDVAIMLMILTLLVTLKLLCLIKPRRTPSMNGLDVQISAIHTMLLGTGAMSVYSGTLKSDSMSWILSFLTRASSCPRSS